MSTSRRGFIQLVGLAAAASRVEAAQPLGAPGTRSSIIRLSSNENSSGPGPRVMAAIEDAFSLVNRYNFRNAHQLGGAIAPIAGVGADNVILGCGSSEILDAACLAFLRPDLGLLTASPTFELVADRAEQLGILAKLDGGLADPSKTALDRIGGLVVGREQSGVHTRGLRETP